MLGLAARMKLQAFDHDFIDSQFLLNVGSRNDEFLKKGMRQAKQTLGQVPFLDLMGGGHDRRGRGRAGRLRPGVQAGSVVSPPRRPGGCAGRPSSCSCSTRGPE